MLNRWLASGAAIGCAIGRIVAADVPPAEANQDLTFNMCGLASEGGLCAAAGDGMTRAASLVNYVDYYNTVGLPLEVVTTQQTCESEWQYLANNMPSRGYKSYYIYIANGHTDCGIYGNAMFTRTQVQANNFFVGSYAATIPNNPWGCLDSSGNCRGWICFIISDRMVCGTHLTHNNPPQRDDQARQMRDGLDYWTYQGYRASVQGDLNTVPTADGHAARWASYLESDLYHNNATTDEGRKLDYGLYHYPQHSVSGSAAIYPTPYSDHHVYVSNYTISYPSGGYK